MSYPTVHRETERVARKGHACVCCPAPITRGDRYVEHFSVSDGDPYSAKLCLPCRDLIHAIFDHMEDPDEGLDFADPAYEVRSLEDDEERRPLCLAWYARRRCPVRYVGERRFSFSWCESAELDLRIVNVGCEREIWPCLDQVVLETRGPLADVDVDALRARFLAASDDELLGLVASVAGGGPPASAWRVAA